MLYAVDIHVSGDFNLFTIDNESLEGIIDDINYYKDNYIVKKSNKKVAILKENSEVIYFFNKCDRTKKVMRLVK